MLCGGRRECRPRPSSSRNTSGAGGSPYRHPEWFAALVLYKMAAIVASIVKRNRALGREPDVTQQMVGDVGRTLDAARQQLAAAQSCRTAKPTDNRNT